MKYLMWLLKAAIFFTLFAFALNNQQEAGMHFFFGYQWRAPMVLIVLTAFAAGLVVGAMGMLPHWWRSRRRLAAPTSPADVALAPTPPAPEPVFVQPDAPADERPSSPRP